MTALIGLLISTTAVVLLNLGWGKRKTEHWASGCVAASAWISSISIFIMACVVSPSALLATIGFVLLLIVGKLANLSARPMTIISCLIYSLFWIWSLTNYVALYMQYEEWKKQVPMESMQQRVPEPKSNNDEPTTQTEQDYTEIYRSYVQSARNRSIVTIHNQTIAAFDRAAGFGAIRMIVIHPQAKDFLPDATPPVQQPAKYDPNIASLGEELQGEFRPKLSLLHYKSSLDFANPVGWGYIKSRAEVAGFQSHRFSKLPEADNGWKADRIDLISLLLHDRPVAYISESLPRMEDIGKLKLRELDEFETAGLAHVRIFDELFIRGNQRHLRVIGSLRNVTECQKCHGGKVGDLLGAFSYNMSKVDPPARK
jgi:hypothetical protein